MKDGIIEQEKSPWIWKAAIVALPLGLALSTAFALIKKVSEPAKTGLEGVTYLAGDFDVAGLRDATEKMETTVGVRDFETQAGQKAMLQGVSLIQGSLSSLNLGYRVKTDEGEVLAGKIWKNYWIDSSEKGKGILVVWARYGEVEDSASVAALLSVAEWLRGREFERQVRVAFLRNGESLSSVLEEGAQAEPLTTFEVSQLGRGSRNLLQTGEPAAYKFIGEPGVMTATDWKLTSSWELFEWQVRELCEEVSKAAGEKVVFSRK